MRLFRDLLGIRNILIVILTPVCLLPLPLLIEGTESLCAYVIMIMAVFWITEALPINVTALLPVFMFPMVGVLSSKEVTGAFLTATTLMFTGGMAVAVAIEVWDLHKRIALRILLSFGTSPVWIMMGLMLTSWFLSMWISNTATTAMMLPIATAILEQLRSNQPSNVNEESSVWIELTEDNKGEADKSMRRSNYDNNQNNVADAAYWKRLSTAFSLAIAYAANIGGTGSLTGTTPNLVLQDQIDAVYQKLGRGSPLTFGTWLMFGAPTSLVIVLASWVWLQAYFLRCSCCRGRCKNGSSCELDSVRVKQILREQFDSLGPFSFSQAAVLFHLVALSTLWITRDIGGTFGWSRLFKDKFMKDSVPAILVCCLLFVVPSRVPRIFCCRNDERRNPPLLTWEQFNRKMPWGVIFLLGGGFSMATAARVSGLSDWIGHKLSELSDLDPWVLNLVLCFIVAVSTEVISNTAITSLILPILAELATKLGLEPVYLMLPATIAASFAFMLPVATPPNSVVFSYGNLKVIDMVKAGFLLNIIAVLILIGSMETLGKLVF